MEAKEVYAKLLELSQNNSLTIRTDINDYDKTLQTNGQQFVGHDKLEFFINSDNKESYRVWHYLSNDNNYEYLEIDDLLNKKQWVFEDKKV